MDFNPKKVSKKKIVFVQIDEEITGLFERIVKLPYKEIYLMVPKRAVLLQSVVNLKILKQKLLDEGKEIALITDDMNGMKLAHQAEIRVFDHWNLNQEVDAEVAKNETTLLKPIAATSNEINEDLPSRLPKKKSSIFDIVKSNKGKETGFSFQSILSNRKQNRLERESFPIRFSGGGGKFVGGLLIVSVLIFGVIAYVALPGATLNIEPASNVVSKAVNINLVSKPSDPRELESYPVTTTVTLTISQNASGIVSRGSRSEGDLTIYNKTVATRGLVASTRFQTSDGLVFRIQNGVDVPAGTPDSPGSVSVHVVADEVDANGVAIGSRGNIGPSKFILPGLSQGTQELIYAESTIDFSGGATDVKTKVLEDDILAAKEKLISQLKEKALSSLRKEVLSVGNKKGLMLSLLEDSDVIQYGNPSIDLPLNMIGQEVESFEVTGTMKITGVSYDASALTEILGTELVKSITPGKQLVRIDEDSVSINVFEADNASKSYKFTATLQGIEEYEIDPSLEGGGQLAKKIKEHIAGKTIDEAASYVQSLPEVNKVDIKVWPVWSPNIPSLNENIKIRSLSKSDVIELIE